jgi:uncharacterized protein (TIGR03000 family)
LAHYGYRPYAHYGYRGYNRFDGGYPYVGSYYAYPYYGDYGSGLYGPFDNGPYDAYPYASPDVTAGSVYDDIYADETPPDTSGYLTAAPATGDPSPAAAAPADDRAHLTVTVPAGARLWFDDTATAATGPVREFQTPPLTPGRRYAYTVRARWDDNGHEVTRTQRVEFAAGARVDVHFPAPTATAAQKPAATQG